MQGNARVGGLEKNLLPYEQPPSITLPWPSCSKGVTLLWTILLTRVLGHNQGV